MKKRWFDYPETHWRYRLAEFLRGFRRVRNAWWWVRYHTTDRYHILDLRSKNYRYGWRDVPEKMEAACFALLVDFVEKEKGFDCHVDWDYSPEFRATRAKAMELYNWWKEGQHREDAFLSLICRDAPEPMTFVPVPGQPNLSEMVFTKDYRWKLWQQYHDKFEAKRGRMLAMLMDIRKYLWT